MKINKQLNLVVPIDSEEGEIYFYSSPIHREVFKKYSLVICKAFTELLQNGLETTGAQIAANHLEEVAISMGKWEGEHGVKNGLMEEIARLTNVLVLTDEGWDTVPVNLALSRGFISEDDWEEAKQRIVFFTLVSVMTPPAVRNDLCLIMNSTWGTQTGLWTAMEFINSLQTSTNAKNTKKKQSSVPV
ncbi:MAG TPA: hypothetical protein VFM18_24445 [Methanosarcina sp.]|nr:hypothetical protein [Methanosarcina sp.]